MKQPSDRLSDTTEYLAARGYWPARAARQLAGRKYSKVVELCQSATSGDDWPLSARLLSARALYHAGQRDASQEQLYRVLAQDATNLLAQKYLGDICFADGDEMAAMFHYQRVLDIDPQCAGLRSSLSERKPPTTRTLTLSRKKADKDNKKTKESSKKIPFYSETIGDLYLTQGYPRLAEKVYLVLSESNDNPRLSEKLALARTSILEKEK